MCDVPVGSPVNTLQGETLTVDATLAMTDILKSNGVIHVLDKVILPRP